VPNFTAGTSFTDGVTNDVTAAKLNALVADAVPTSSLALASTTGTISNFTTSTATVSGPITASTAVINVGSGQIYKDASGNVGMGTTSPASKLHIKDGTNYNLLIRQQSSKMQMFSANDAYSPISMDFLASSYSFNYGAGGANALTIDSSGNVGIGSSSPLSRLNVQSDNNTNDLGQLIISGNTNSNKRLSVGFNTTSNYGFMQSLISGDNYYPLVLQNNGGNVGIGTASPTANLHVVKTTSQTDIDSATQVVSITNTASDTSGNLTGIRLRQDNATNVAQGYIGLSSTGNSATRANLIVATPNTSGNSTERLRIDASGNVGIGTSSPSGRLHVSAAKNEMIFQSSTATNYLLNNYANGNSATLFMGVEGSSSGRTDINATLDNASFFGSRTAHPVQFISNNSARMTIDSSGRLIIGSTSPAYSSVRLGVNFTGAGSEYGMGLNAATLNTGTQWIEFTSGSVGSATARGSIDWSGSAVRYNTSSDYRLKENIVEISDGIERLKQLKPSKFNFIEYPDKTVDGFIAHEVHDIIPEAVSGEKDAVNSDGKPIYQGIDQSKIVPLLTAALKEAIAKIETLEAKVTALEAA
jgi:Chaperone of endosialidase